MAPVTLTLAELQGKVKAARKVVDNLDGPYHTIAFGIILMELLQHDYTDDLGEDTA